MFSRLPNDLFERTRSFLTFNKLHSTRRVSKRWHDISGTTKSITLDEDSTIPIPPPDANFFRVENLEAWFEIDHMSAGWYNDLEDCFLSIIKSSSSCLKKLLIGQVDDENLQTIRQLEDLPNLTDCTLYEVLSIDAVDIIFSKAPNLHSLSLIIFDEVEIDFSKISKVKELKLDSVGIGKVINPEMCNIEVIGLSDMAITDDVERNLWNDAFLRRLQTVQIDSALWSSDSFCLPSAVKDWIVKRPKLCVKSTFETDYETIHFEYSVANKTFVIEQCSKIEGDAEAIVEHTAEARQLFKMWKAITPFTLEFSPKIETEKKRKLFCLVSSLLDVFSMEDLAKILH